MLIATLLVIYFVCFLGTAIYVTIQAEKRGVEFKPRYILILIKIGNHPYKDKLTRQERVTLSIGNLWAPLFLFFTGIIGSWFP